MIRFCVLRGVIAILLLLAEAGTASHAAFGYDSPSYVYDDVVSCQVAPCSVSSEGDLAAETRRYKRIHSIGKSAGSIEERVRLPSDFVAPSPGGTTLVADDLVSKRVAERAPVATGQHNVVLHGDADGFVGATLNDVAAAVRADPSYGGQPICLLSCNSATNGSAQALANELGVSVMAPTGRAGVPRPPAAPYIGIEPGTQWRWFLSGGN